MAQRLPVMLLTMLLATPLAAQQSAGFKAKEHVLNAGGHPQAGISPSSASYRISLGSLGAGPHAIGLSSPSFRSDGGFLAAFPPPGEVAGLRFVGRETLQWSADGSIGGYNLYRGLLSALPGMTYGTCLQQAIPDETAPDPDLPATGSGYFYLVTAVNRLGEEGTKGSSSAGARRTGSTCP